MQFTGLKTANTKNTSDSKRVVGEPCIHKGHFSLDNGFRRGVDLACLQCLEDLKDPKINFNPSELNQRAVNARVRFWSRVDICDPEECWSYSPKNVNNKMEVFWVRKRLYSNYTFHPIRVSNWLAWGDTGLMATKTRCGQRYCVNPLHNYPSCITEEQIINQDLDDVRKQLEILKQDICSYLNPATIFLEDQNDLTMLKAFGVTDIRFSSDQDDVIATSYQSAYEAAMKHLLNV